MRSPNKAAVLAIALAHSSSAAAEKAQVTWRYLPETTSAGLASSGQCRLLESSGLSWPDGAQALVTFWSCGKRATPHDTVTRRVDYFSRDMQDTGSKCEMPRFPE